MPELTRQQKSEVVGIVRSLLETELQSQFVRPRSTLESKVRPSATAYDVLGTTLPTPGLRESGPWYRAALTEALPTTLLTALTDFDGSPLGLDVGSTITMTASVNNVPLTQTFTVSVNHDLAFFIAAMEAYFTAATFTANADGTVTYRTDNGTANEITSLAYTAVNAAASTLTLFNGTAGASTSMLQRAKNDQIATWGDAGDFNLVDEDTLASELSDAVSPRAFYSDVETAKQMALDAQKEAIDLNESLERKVDFELAEKSDRMDVDVLRAQTASGIIGVGNLISNHTSDSEDAHDASAISYVGGTGMAATDVEAAIDELADEKISASVVDAKGDLIVATAADTVARVAAGADGTVPTYDDAATAGVVARRLAVPITVERLRACGSAVISANMELDVAVSAVTLNDGQIRCQAVYLPYDVTLTGVWFVQGTQGSYTDDNNGKVALYTLSGTTMTRVAQSANDGTLFENATGSFRQKAFSSTYAATAGVYYVALLVNWSAVVTSPTLMSQTSSQQALQTLDLAAGTGLSAFINGQTDMPASFTVAGTQGGPPLVGVY